MCRMVGQVWIDEQGTFAEAASWLRWLAQHGRLRRGMTPRLSPLGLRHGDGVGYALLPEAEGTLEVERRGAADWADPTFWDRLTCTEGLAAILHTRRSSGSATTADLAHPYLVPGFPIAVAHNGTLYFEESVLPEGESDTSFWLREFVRPRLQPGTEREPEAVLQALKEAFEEAAEEALKPDKPFSSLTLLVLSPYWLIAQRWYNDQQEGYGDYYTLYYWQENGSHWWASEPPGHVQARLLNNGEAMVVQWDEPEHVERINIADL